ncbi:UDP-N-acetylmuramoyl-L-alanyl-D-glutamate synthetase [Sulfurimonas gotlandica GD1]|uniref:UDP-N-acetylmuramoylalanine--D-glutamate ligase n=1 Tax=Sulfurimonas gotlandica (strain DSM 19862 / JCM 16533 / GD1) TaxID=929558 RepID=B6BKY4_SULGG|nr:UDP-N-acetylmuramoyl-L-alanine--D-glutamate ligase [Sulfurimonas gotlandica]EDZ62320.1 UDP-N-acetylmuramoylalanine--D-glutamate ligase [Sulfurimonas gotlandica GD1]EHP29197.1 UDP-N-acetylmuramoyl-L-alanyl-D-glutamate synthetase [Sulfurimonas gotlandica GD1]
MQRVSLFGYGKTTKAIAKVAKEAIFYDDKCTKPFRDENGFMVKPSSEFNAKYSQLEIPSPGIPPSNPLILKANNLISEYDYFTESSPLSIWISGTNGKTTTTQMMQHLLESKGSQAGGNIGTPLAELSLDAKMWILETSSFTMHYTNIATPNIYVLLPLSPDHLSWHGSMQEYVDAKLKPLATMKEGEVAIIPDAYKDVKTDAHIITYKDEKNLAERFGIDASRVNFKGAFLADALLAMAVDKVLFDKIDYKKINSFVLDPHRQEELRDAKNRLWVNDTKATNIDASIAALKRYKDSRIHLILGGDDKGVDLNELFVYLQNLNVSIYNIGSNKEKLSKLAKEYKIDSNLCLNLADAISKIDKNLAEKEVALLSPAAASLDEFTSYAQRGDQFKEAVRNIS